MYVHLSAFVDRIVWPEAADAASCEMKECHLKKDGPGARKERAESEKQAFIYVPFASVDEYLSLSRNVEDRDLSAG